MTDLVERLYDKDGRWMSRYCKPQRVGELRNEAAAEIERLRADYSILKGDYDMLREELADVRADSALLRAALEPKP